jgi:hypothetical protein
MGIARSVIGHLQQTPGLFCMLALHVTPVNYAALANIAC